ncbi:hypothetical protein AVEN_83012-1 [Araneus ventricosus]|uniref:Uncharacterized protein n=1 Tax=Araneus ventricosus TaxID=182803 RepID=A0A4Y2GNQ8_ARAVE|nr:hypothetical protein AVEN_83012-1 [Araneus ventricosus]
MATASNYRFLMSSKPTNECVLHLCQKQFETINIVIANKDSSSKMPRTNPFQLHSYIKQVVPELSNITNMKYTRQGKLLFSTSDPVYVAKHLALQNVLIFQCLRTLFGKTLPRNPAFVDPNENNTRRTSGRIIP